LRRFLNKRNLLIAFAVLVCVGVSAIAGFLVYLNSDAFNDRVRRSFVQEIEAQTGGTTSVGKIRWNLREQRLVLEDLTIRGTEPQGEPPLAHIESITAGLSLRNLLQRRLDLFELNVLHPRLRLLVTPDGRTNLPGAPKRPDTSESTFAVSIRNLKVIEGTALVNNRQTRIDFTLSNVASDSVYHGDTQVLSAKVTYSGAINREHEAPIPYTLSTDFDFTRGTFVAQRIEVASGKSTAKLQGRIDHALTEEIAGKLDYSGDFEAGLLGHFLPKEKIAGRAKAKGAMDFRRDTFSTTGDLASERAGINGWEAAGVRTRYSYNYSDKKLALTKLIANAFGGQTTGTLNISPLPGDPRVTLDLNYSNIDSAQLAKFFPWDAKYGLYSRASGHVQGWIEGRAEQFEVEGDSTLASYTPPAIPGVVAFPVSGTVSFAATPGNIDVRSSDISFFETSIQASGRVHEMQTVLTVKVKSSNLANFHFLNKDANGEGSFEGRLIGALKKPTLEGNFILDKFKHADWNIQHAQGNVVLNTDTNVANLNNVQATIGQTTALINGTVSTDGSAVNLRIRSDRVRAEDFAFLLKEKVEGILAGDVLLTSLTPLKVRGHVSGSKLSARNRTFESMEGDLTYSYPAVEFVNLTASERGARLTDGRVRFNTMTEEIDAQATVAALNLNRVRDLGVPETIDGNIQRARLTVGGTLTRPSIGGDATIENLAFRGEVFPRARLQLSTAWPTLTAVLSEAGNIDLTAQIDLSDKARYPFQATTKFQNYSLEKLARFSHGTLTASGTANLKGSILGAASLSGTGVIQSLHTRILDDYPFDGAKPFAFSFDPNQLKLTDVATLNGPRGTKVNLEGSIGLTDSPKLELTANGNLDLRTFAELSDAWSITGIVDFDGHISGTTLKPNIDGKATLKNASLGHEGIYTTLSQLNGDLRFSENRVTFEDLEGRVSGGKIKVRGNGLIQNNQLEGLNVRIDADQVRFRYPAGLTSVATGSLLVRGTSKNPAVDGNLTLDSVRFRSDFESFLTVFRPGGLDSGISTLDGLRLSIHVSGNRNITIQNEVADISSGRINLDIKGTLGSPSLTGHVETSEGVLLIQGKRYDITRGNIDFTDQLRIDPIVDIQAESDLRDYRVILRVAGRGENLHIDMASDPPLSQLELVNLMAGGKTLRELEEAGAERLPTNDEQFQGTAASVLTDMLRSKLGNRYGLLGLDRVKIDPYLVGAGNKSAQITLSVTRELSVTYSQDLSSNQQRVIQVEYFLTKNLSLVASREENNESSALGLDIRLRKRF
jgi:translocation and assembly module TamB